MALQAKPRCRLASVNPLSLINIQPLWRFNEIVVIVLYCSCSTGWWKSIAILINSTNHNKPFNYGEMVVAQLPGGILSDDASGWARRNSQPLPSWLGTLRIVGFQAMDLLHGTGHLALDPRGAGPVLGLESVLLLGENLIVEWDGQLRRRYFSLLIWFVVTRNFTCWSITWQILVANQQTQMCESHDWGLNAYNRVINLGRGFYHMWVSCTHGD